MNRFCRGGAPAWRRIAMALGVFITVTPFLALSITLTDQNHYAIIDPSSQAGLNAIGAGTGQPDFSGQQWYWFRIGETNPNVSIDTLGRSVLSGTPNTCDLMFSNDAVSLELMYEFNGGFSTSDIQQDLVISNRTASPLPFHLIKFSHMVPKNGAPVVSVFTDTGFYIEAKQSDGFAYNFDEIMEWEISSDVTYTAEASIYPQTLNELNSGVPYDLNDTLLAGPDDVTWAVEWSFTLQPGESAVILSDTRADSYPQPVIAPIPDRTVSVGELIRFTNHASGSYPPYGFSLGTGFAQQGPTGASVNPTNGIFQWRPAANQAGTTNVIKVVCDDGYMPVGWSTQQFTVVVRDYVQVTAGSTAVGAGEIGSIPLTIACSAALTNIAFDICASASSVAGLTVSPTGSVAGAQINQSSPGVWHVNLTTNPGEFLQGTQMMAVLQLTTVSNQPSSLIPVGFSNIAPAAGKGPMLSDIAGLAGQLAILNGAPLLTGSPGGHGVVNLILYGDTSAHYAIQSISQLIPPWIWADCTQVNLSSRVTNLSVAVPGQYNFYRARKF